MHTIPANVEQWKTGQEENLALIRKHEQKTDRAHKGQQETIETKTRKVITNGQN